MKKRERNALLKRITTKDYLDINKIPNLNYDERKRLIMELVRRRVPIVVELIPDPFDIKPFDMDWLHCCGYLYTQKNDRYTFLCTGEHKIK
jgi:hypothetical protein